MRPSFLQDRMQPKFGPPPKDDLKGGLKDLLEASLEDGERVYACTEGGMGEALIATNRRVMVLKCGLMAGAFKEPLCFAFPYEDIYLFEWGNRRRILEIVPFRDVGKKKAGITFLPFHDKAFNNAVHFMAQRVVECRKKKPEVAEKAKQHAQADAKKSRW